MTGRPDVLLYRVGEAAEVLGLSRPTLYRLMGVGLLGSVQVGRARRIPRTALEDYVASLTTQKGTDDEGQAGAA
jgi:excisionase family DNA binding protein